MFHREPPGWGSTTRVPLMLDAGRICTITEK
jgi:hypothetical protein